MSTPIKVIVSGKGLKKPYSYTLKVKADADDAQTIGKVREHLVNNNPGKQIGVKWVNNRHETMSIGV